jgi:hypothetical protein
LFRTSEDDIELAVKCSPIVIGCIAVAANGQAIQKGWTPVGITGECLWGLPGRQRKCLWQAVRILERMGGTGACIWPSARRMGDITDPAI